MTVETTKRTHNSPKDKWIAEKMPGDHPYKVREPANWQVKNMRTGRTAAIACSEYDALRFANEINLKGYIDA